MALGESSRWAWLFFCRQVIVMLVKISADRIKCPAKKISKRCLTGKRGSVTKTVAAAGGAELTKNKPLDSDTKVCINYTTEICSLKTK